MTEAVKKWLHYINDAGEIILYVLDKNKNRSRDDSGLNYFGNEKAKSHEQGYDPKESEGEDNVFFSSDSAKVEYRVSHSAEGCVDAYISKLGDFFKREILVISHVEHFSL